MRLIGRAGSGPGWRSGRASRRSPRRRCDACAMSLRNCSIRGPWRSIQRSTAADWIAVASARKEFEPQLLEIALQTGDQQALPLVGRLEPRDLLLRPVEAERLTKLGIGLGQCLRVEPDAWRRARKCRTRRRARKSAPVRRRSQRRRRGPSRCSRRASASLRTSERISLVVAAEIVRIAGCSSATRSATLSSAPVERRMSETWLRTDRAATWNSSIRTASDTSASSIRSHNLGRSSRCSAARKATATWPQRRAFFLGQAERDARAEPVDDPVGDLGGEDFMPQPMGADRIGMGLDHRRRESGEQLAAEHRIVGELAIPRSHPVATILAIDRTTASSGRVRPRWSRPRRSSTSLDPSPSTLRSRRPLASSNSMARTCSGKAFAAARFGNRKRKALQAVVLQHQLRHFVGHADKQARCALPRSAALRASRG